jgi:streptogramin lyase
VTRFDQVSGRVQHRITVPGTVSLIAPGAAEMWTVTQDGILARLDPIRNAVVRPAYQTGAGSPGALIALAGNVWVCDCINHQVIGFDPERNRVVHRVTLPEHGFLFGIDSTGDGETMWLLDPDGRTLTPLDPATGTEGQPLGVPGEPRSAVIAFGSIWVASGRAVYRIDLTTHRETRIALPPGVTAAGIAFDAPSKGVWVENCGCSE